jgi:hypothetical protein
MRGESETRCSGGKLKKGEYFENLRDDLSEKCQTVLDSFLLDMLSVFD